MCMSYIRRLATAFVATGTLVAAYAPSALAQQTCLLYTSPSPRD